MLNIDATAVIEHTATLEKLHRSALPLAIRNTLTSVAFDVKKTTMPAEAEKAFTVRAPNFFKAKSRVDMARGWDIGSMQSVVGFTGSDQAVQDLEQQEYGGTIESRSFIPLDVSRTSGHASKVKPSNRLSKIKRIVNSNTIEGKTPKAKFWNAVKKAGKGGYVIGNNSKQTLFKVERITPLKIKPLYSFKRGRDVDVDQTHFMRTASLASGEKINSIYIREAQKQIARIAAK